MIRRKEETRKKEAISQTSEDLTPSSMASSIPQNGLDTIKEEEVKVVKQNGPHISLIKQGTNYNKKKVKAVKAFYGSSQ